MKKFSFSTFLFLGALFFSGTLFQSHCEFDRTSLKKIFHLFSIFRNEKLEQLEESNRKSLEQIKKMEALEQKRGKLLNIKIKELEKIKKTQTLIKHFSDIGIDFYDMFDKYLKKGVEIENKEEFANNFNNFFSAFDTLCEKTPLTRKDREILGKINNSYREFMDKFYRNYFLDNSFIPKDLHPSKVREYMLEAIERKIRPV